MGEPALQDPLLIAVRKARPAIDDAVLSPTSADALKVLERVLHGENTGVSHGVKATRGQEHVGRRRGPAIRRVLRARIAIAAAAAAVAVVIALSTVTGAPSLVDRAYAAINVGDQVLHEVDIMTDTNAPGFYDRLEGWLLPADGRARLIDITGYRQSRFVTALREWVITATGRVFGRSCLSGCRVGQIGAFINGRSGWTSEGSATEVGGFGSAPRFPGTFAQWFRAAYRARSIVPDGTTTFAGKDVARFQSMAGAFEEPLVTWRPGTPAPMSVRNRSQTPYILIDWYVDPATARPVGFSVRACTGDAIRSCTQPGSSTRIVTFQRLDPTPQNLAQLTAPGAPPGSR